MTVQGWVIYALTIVGLGFTYKVVFGIKLPKRKKKNWNQKPK